MSSSMRIAQVALRFDAPGGVETTVREISGRLHRAGEEVEVFASDLYDESRWERRGDFRPTVDGVPVHRFPVYRRLVPGLTMPLMTGLIDALSDARPDVIHAHSHRYGHVLEAALAARARSVPLVVSLHYHPAHPGESARKRALLRVQDELFGVAAYRGAAALVVETGSEARWAEAFAPRSRIRVIPPGIDLAEWTDPSSGPAPEGLPERYVLYAGRVASNKGLPALARALGRIPAAERPTLVLMGRDWGARAEVEAAARASGSEASLVWLGHVADSASYRAVFRRASAFVLPSEYEAFGLVLLEAMAARVPIVATAVGGVPEVLEGGRSGTLVPLGDEAALAAALRRVLAEPGVAERYRTEGTRRVSELTWDRAMAAHRTMYRELADRSGA